MVATDVMFGSWDSGRAAIGAPTTQSPAFHEASPENQCRPKTSAPVALPTRPLRDKSRPDFAAVADLGISVKQLCQRLCHLNSTDQRIRPVIVPEAEVSNQLIPEGTRSPSTSACCWKAAQFAAQFWCSRAVAHLTAPGEVGIAWQAHTDINCSLRIFATENT